MIENYMFKITQVSLVPMSYAIDIIHYTTGDDYSFTQYIHMIEITRAL